LNNKIGKDLSGGERANYKPIGSKRTKIQEGKEQSSGFAVYI
jgi:hypothetical protein